MRKLGTCSEALVSCKLRDFSLYYFLEGLNELGVLGCAVLDARGLGDSRVAVACAVAVEDDFVDDGHRERSVEESEIHYFSN